MERKEFEARVTQLREQYSEHLEDCFDDAIFDYAPGWFELVSTVFRETDRIQGGRPWLVHQVKEKFGGLRIYGSELGDLPLEAEAQSLETCMYCGSPATRVEIDGWHSTLCPKCEALCRQDSVSLDSHWHQLTTPAKPH